MVALLAVKTRSLSLVIGPKGPTYETYEIRGSLPAVPLPHARTKHDKVSALLLGSDC